MSLPLLWRALSELEQADADVQKALKYKSSAPQQWDPSELEEFSLTAKCLVSCFQQKRTELQKQILISGRSSSSPSEKESGSTGEGVSGRTPREALASIRTPASNRRNLLSPPKSGLSKFWAQQTPKETRSSSEVSSMPQTESEAMHSVASVRSLISEAEAFLSKNMAPKQSREKPLVDNSPRYSFCNGKWTKTYQGEALDSGQKSTVLGRLKKKYDRQCRNILRLEKERNGKDVEIARLKRRISELERK